MLFTKNYQNRSMIVEATACQNWRIFWDSVFSVVMHVVFFLFVICLAQCTCRRSENCSAADRQHREVSEACCNVWLLGKELWWAVTEGWRSRHGQYSVHCLVIVILIVIKGLHNFYSATYMSQTRDQQRFTISEVAADWHEPMVPQRIMWPSTACTNGQLDPRCS